MKGYIMEDTTALQVNLRMLRQDLKQAFKRQKVLCPLLAAMVANYNAEGHLDGDLIEHATVLMNELFNYLQSMEAVLTSDDIPF